MLLVNLFAVDALINESFLFAETRKLPETTGRSIRQGGQRQEGCLRGEFLETELQTEMVLPKRREWTSKFDTEFKFHISDFVLQSSMIIKLSSSFCSGTIPFVEVQVQERRGLLPADHLEPEGRRHRQIHYRNFRHFEHRLPQCRGLVRFIVCIFFAENAQTIRSSF